MYTIPSAPGEETGGVLLSLPRQTPRKRGVCRGRGWEVEGRCGEGIIQVARGPSGRMDYSYVSTLFFLVFCALNDGNLVHPRSGRHHSRQLSVYCEGL